MSAAQRSSPAQVDPLRRPCRGIGAGRRLCKLGPQGRAPCGSGPGPGTSHDLPPLALAGPAGPASCTRGRLEAPRRHSARTVQALASPLLSWQAARRTWYCGQPWRTPAPPPGARAPRSVLDRAAPQSHRIPPSPSRCLICKPSLVDGPRSPRSGRLDGRPMRLALASAVHPLAATPAPQLPLCAQCAPPARR